LIHVELRGRDGRDEGKRGREREEERQDERKCELMNDDL
jgi:hypothetical protein